MDKEQIGARCQQVTEGALQYPSWDHKLNTCLVTDTNQAVNVMNEYFEAEPFDGAYALIVPLKQQELQDYRDLLSQEAGKSFAGRFNIVQDAMSFVTRKDQRHMIYMPILVVQLGNILVYIRKNEVQEWDCTPTDDTEVDIRFMSPKPDFEEKAYANLKIQANAITYIKQHIGGDLLGPEVKFGNVETFTMKFKDPAAPDYEFQGITAKVFGRRQRRNMGQTRARRCVR